ncbi:Transcription elongation factor SPT4 [Gurleya vavrai]
MEFPSTYSKKLKACLNCCFLQTSQQFKKSGCPNCLFFNTRSKSDNSNYTTSDSYKGLIGLVKPQRSWVAKWLRMNENVSGLYAMNVDGILPDEFINRVEENGKIYYPRDKSFTL